MKRIVLGSLLATSLMFAATSSNVCPDLAKKSSDIQYSEGLKDGLKKTNIVAWDVYSDSLSAYNKTLDIDEFITKDSFNQYTITPIWGQLFGLKTLILDINTNPDLKSKLNIAYANILKLIESSNNNWCNKVVNMDKTQSTNIIQTTNLAVKKAFATLEDKDK